MQDGTVSTFTRCLTVVRDFSDVCVHSYFSIMKELRTQGIPNGKYYEIRFHHLSITLFLIDQFYILISCYFSHPFILCVCACRLLYLPGAIIISVIGFLVDFPMISIIALFKSVYMLFKGWHRMFHDLIGREGPFLETICVPFAGLAILLWPLAVVGAVLASIVASIFIGAFAGVVVYQVYPRHHFFSPNRIFSLTSLIMGRSNHFWTSSVS